MQSPPPVIRVEVRGKKYQNIHAWQQGDPVWRLVDNCSVAVTFTMETENKRYRNMATAKMKLHHIQTVTFSVRIGWRKEITFTIEKFNTGGTKATVRKIIKLYQSGWLWNEARYQAQARAREMGIDSVDIIAADQDTNWRKSRIEQDRESCQNVYALMEKRKAA